MALPMKPVYNKKSAPEEMWFTIHSYGHPSLSPGIFTALSSAPMHLHAYSGVTKDGKAFCESKAVTTGSTGEAYMLSEISAGKAEGMFWGFAALHHFKPTTNTMGAEDSAEEAVILLWQRRPEHVHCATSDNGLALGC